MNALTKDKTKAIQFCTKLEAIKASKNIPGFGSSDVVSVEVMGFYMWSICDHHMNYVSKAYYDAQIDKRR